MNQVQRKKYTEQKIKNAFLKIKDKKALSDITITEICKKAEISRPTFYKYYNNTLDVLENILRDICDMCCFSNEVPTMEEIKTTCSEKFPLCKLVREHKEFHGILLDTSLNQQVIDFFLQNRMNQCEKEKILFFRYHSVC